MWRYAATSVTGTSHLAIAKECQDAHRCAYVTGSGGKSALAIIVSDGAGSAQHGAKGANHVVCSLVAQAQGWLENGTPIPALDRATFRSWLDGIREAIAEEAGNARLQLRDYAATLLFAMVDDTHSVYAQIGDGALVTHDAVTGWSAQFWPQHGIYANQTYFVTDDCAHEKLEFAHGLNRIEEIAVFSDGLERLLLNLSERVVHAPAFEKMLGPLRHGVGRGHVPELSSALEAYLSSSPISSRTDDDVTLVLATRLPTP